MGILGSLLNRKRSKSKDFEPSNLNPNVFENSILTRIGPDLPDNSVLKEAIAADKKLKEERYAQLNANRDKFMTMTESRLPYINSDEVFNITDLKDGKPGIRHGGKVNKQIVGSIAEAAAKEGVSLDVALSTAMRETGIGNVHNINYPTTYEVGIQYDPTAVMSSWNAKTGVEGYPMDYDAFRLKHGLVDNQYVEKWSSGWQIENNDPGMLDKKNLDKYEKYISEFKFDKSLNDPFRKEMRFLKKNQGQKYNPGEEGRDKKLDYDLDVIKRNPELYEYAKSVYDKSR